MGKASSAKKVARAAGIGGGRTSRGRRPWGYYSIVVVIVVLGVLGVWQSRNNRLAKINANGTGTAPTVGSTSEAGFAVDICGKFQPNIKATKDPEGLTTNGDGIIHMHPYTKSAAGKNATLGLFASSIGLNLNAAEVQMPGGHLYLNGDKCGGTPAYVAVRHFLYPGDTVGVLENQDPQNIHLDAGTLYTVAFVPKAQDNKIPAPPASVVSTLEKLLSASSAPSTTVPNTTVPVTPPTTAKTPTTTPAQTPTTR
jgi:hypothetical protein